MTTTQAQQLIADTAAGTLLTAPTYSWRDSWWTWRTFADRFGVLVANDIYAAIKANSGEAAAISFASYGLDAKSQATRDSLADLVSLSVVTAEQAEVVLASSRQETDSPLARYGVADPTTPEALSEATRIVDIQNKIDKVQNAAGYIANEVLIPLFGNSDAIPSDSNIADLFAGRLE